MRKSIIGICVVFCFFGSYTSAEAGLFVTKDTYVLPTNESVKENLYVASDSISLEGKVSGDVFGLGNSITVLGPVTGDIFLAGSELDVVFPTQGDVRVLGEHVFVASSTAGDVIAFGDTVHIGQGVTVGGDVFVLASKTNMQGVFKGDVSVQGDSVVLEGLFKGDVSVKARDVLIKKGTVIDGVFSYRSTKPAVMEEEVNIKTIDFVPFEVRPMTWGILSFVGVFFLLKTLMCFFAGLVLFVLFRRFIEACATEATLRPVALFGWGLLFVVGVPVIIVLSFVTVVGSMIGGSLASFYIAFIVLSKILSSIVVGIWSFSLFNRDRAVIEYMSWKVIAVGAILSTLLMFIPIIGWLIIGASFFVATGTLLRLFHDRIWLNR
jgi:cytoskeletal protein CcmA (bactofilin family)